MCLKTEYKKVWISDKFQFQTSGYFIFPLHTYTYVLTFQTGFRNWCEDMLIPDESFYSTLLHITNVKDLGQSKHSKIGHILDDLEKR